MMREVERFKVALLPVLIITSLAAFLLVAIPAKPLEASPDAQVENFLPVADGEVTEGYPNSVDSTIYNMYNGWNSSYLSERVYFRFDLENIPSGSTIDNAILWANSRYGPSREPGYIDTWHLVDAMSVGNDGWQESTLTWNNAPPMGAVLDTENFQGDDLIGEQYHWYSWDVTSFVKSEFEGGDPIVSIGLKRQDPENTYESAGWFYSKDGDSNLPHLIVRWSEGAPQPGVDVEISPDYKDAENGQTVTFNVKVRNIGGATDSYTLENTDTAGWAMSIPDTVGPISPGSSENVILSVTIPVDAEDGNEDTITVTATSQENTEVSDSDSCTVITSTEVEVRGVEVTIDPMTKSGKPGGELTYTVTVTNTGDEEDTFDLTADPENADWTTNISPASLTLAGGASDTATLTVTTPDDASENDFTTITVTATGTGYDNNATCTAMGVKVEIVFPWVYVAVALVILFIIVIAIIVT